MKNDDFSTKEMSSLDRVSKRSRFVEPAGLATTRYSFDVFKRFIPATGAVLEMGPAEGVMTELLLGYCDELEVVEGSPSFASALKKKHPSLVVYNSLFEDFMPTRKYDAIVLGHVLEHVVDPLSTLSAVSRWLSPGSGIVLAAVPNARSLHRQAAVLMGILDSEHDMSEKDIHHGHRRVYSPESLRAEFSSAGFRIDFFGGYWLKPLSDRQIEQDWTTDMLDAFMVLGERYPEIAGEIYVKASLDV